MGKAERGRWENSGAGEEKVRLSQAPLSKRQGTLGSLHT